MQLLFMPKQLQQQPRIIAGEYKGIRLQVATTSRPITDRMKQSLFDQIADYIPHASVLDLYAGSGSLGLEALSRGASFCTFVDNDFEAQRLLSQNIAKCQATSKSKISKRNVLGFIKECKEAFDLIFVDPSYKQLETVELPLHLFAHVMHKDSLLIIKLPTGYQMRELRTMPMLLCQQFGANKLCYLKSEPFRGE